MPAATTESRSELVDLGHESVGTALRVAVQDCRKLIREGVAALFAAAPTVTSVVCATTLDELSPAIRAGELDLVVFSDPEGPPTAWSSSRVRVYRMTDTTPAAELVEALRDNAESVGMGTPEPGRAALTPRESQILQRIAEGMSSAQVASSLGLSPRTVDNHKQRIYAKLGVRSQAHAIAMAMAPPNEPAQRADTPPDQGPVPVLVGHPSSLVRDLLARAISEATDLNFFGTAGSLRNLSTACVEREPRVVLAACNFPDGDLLDALPDLLATGARVVALTDSTPPEQISTLLLGGVAGCLPLDRKPEQLLYAIRTVAAGHAALHPAAAAAVLRQWRMMRSTPPQPVKEGLASLSPREVDVLRVLALGQPTKTIARELQLSPKTVEAHIGRLLTKLGATNRAQAIAVARSHGLFDGE